MRHLSACLCVLLASATLSNATAQVTTDDRALDALQPAKPATKSPSAPARKAPTHTARTSAHPAPARKIVALPAVPAAPPVNPVILPPPFVMPAHKPPPPPPVPVKADAAGAASALSGGGLRITFGSGSSDLNPATLAALRTLAAQAVADPQMVIGVTAWAPGVQDDPSTPRRLSLDRALAARAVLINAGVVSERIRAVAKGPVDIGDGPADRADLAPLAPSRPAAAK